MIMPHQRPRNILPLLEKRLRHFPVVGVLGPRQSGKSTLIRELLSVKRSISYVTLDREDVRSQAERQPTLFLKGLEDPKVETACIDEIQKAPVLFDTLKAEVDENRRPGRFTITGSTEFSKKTGIRESLTGRIALLKLFPLNIAEILGSRHLPLIEGFATKSKTELTDITQWLDRGGMPGIFAIRDEDHRIANFDNWIETTCTRDVSKFNIPRFNPDLARRIFQSASSLPKATRTEIAKSVGKLPRQIEAYLEAFKSLFILYEIEPFQTSVGKSQFYCFDAGIAKALGASKEKRFQIWLLNEIFSQFSYAGKRRPDIFFYESSRGSTIDFLLTEEKFKFAFKICHDEAPSTYFMRAIDRFKNNNPEFEMLALAPCTKLHRVASNVQIIPWNAVA